MPLSGGVSDKLGNRYEGRWTVACMIEVMDESADSIQLEETGKNTFKFCLYRKGKLEYHQVISQSVGCGIRLEVICWCPRYIA